MVKSDYVFPRWFLKSFQIEHGWLLLSNMDTRRTGTLTRYLCSIYSFWHSG